MATTITVREVPAGRVKTLDPAQTQLFMNEYARVRGPWWFRLIRRIMRMFTRTIPRLRRIQADYNIEIDRNGSVREYELESGVVLRRKRSQVRYQFYFGLLLIRWMEL